MRKIVMFTLYQKKMKLYLKQDLFYIQILLKMQKEVFIKPQIIKNYDGKDVKLKDDKVLSPSVYPDLKNNIGKTLITPDGLTLLGADDKAGIVEIMSMLEYFFKSS